MSFRKDIKEKENNLIAARKLVLKAKKLLEERSVDKS